MYSWMTFRWLKNDETNAKVAKKLRIPLLRGQKQKKGYSFLTKKRTYTHLLLLCIHQKALATTVCRVC